jgi:phage shock protein A
MAEVPPSHLQDRADRALAALDRIRGARVSQLRSRTLADEIDLLEDAFADDAQDALARMRAVESTLRELEAALDRAGESLEALAKRSAVGTP